MSDAKIEYLRTPLGHQHVSGQGQGTAWGPFIFLSAVRGTDPVTGAIDPDMGVQAQQCFANVAALLEGVGSGLQQILKVGMYMVDLHKDRPIVNKVWFQLFPTDGPARFAVQVQDMGGAGDNSRLLVDVTALRDIADESCRA